MGICYRIIIKGKVQGVFFRRKAKYCADTLHILGEIRNLDDGSVEILMKGSQEDVNLLLHNLKEKADSYRIDDYVVQSVKLNKDFTTFEIVR